MANDRAAVWRERQRAVRAGYLGNAQSSAIPSEIRRVILELAPSGSQAETVALFEGRAGYETIKKWWQGEYYFPTWAKEMLRRKLAARHSALVAMLDAGKEKTAKR